MRRLARTDVPQYTYRQGGHKEKTVYRRLAIIGAITVVLLLIIFFWGLTFVNVLGLLGTNKDTASDGLQFQIPLQKPSFDSLPEFTNKETITITGNTSSGAQVVLIVNGIKVGKTITDTTGNFSFIDVVLKEGFNLIKLKASNDSGETQEQSAHITLDKTKPDLTITSPNDKQSFPKGTKTTTVKGKAEPDSTVFVDSIQAILDQNGNFSHVVQLITGENDIEIKATDEAGNSKIIKLGVSVKN